MISSMRGHGEQELRWGKGNGAVGDKISTLLVPVLPNARSRYARSALAPYCLCAFAAAVTR